MSDLKKDLQIFAICLIVDNNLYGKLVLLAPTILDDILKVTPKPFFIADFKSSYS